ncbi:hypothetical protein Tco_0678057 [Tanacetum coccineum]|uniref:Uncharacterized protein n=1 Tax=Tanacetum coccineum TaxID=301880 RepID=A0ABQ4XE11_9ASTR
MAMSAAERDGPSWGIPLMNPGELPKMDPYKEVAQQRQVVPLSPAYVPDPMELEHHIPVYILDAVYLEYYEDSEEDPIDYATDIDDDEEDKEDESSNNDEEEEEHLAPAIALLVVDPAPTAEET